MKAQLKIQKHTRNAKLSLMVNFEFGAITKCGNAAGLKAPNKSDCVCLGLMVLAVRVG